MIRIRKRVTFNVIILISIIIAVMLIEGVGASFFIIKQGKTLKDQIGQLQTEISGNKKIALVAKQKITAGSELKMDMFSKVMVFSSSPQELYVTQQDIEGTEAQKDDFKANDFKLGRWALINIDPGTPVLKTMVADERITNDIRNEEFNVFLLQSDLEKDHFIDLRIMFPTGEDYIVLSKKKVRNLQVDKNTVWLWLTEKDIVTVSSAIVDAYLRKGTKLYTVTYVAPSIQQLSIPNYPVNMDVMKLIRSNPNIVAEAKAGLYEQVRKELDDRLNKMSAAAVASIQAGVSQEQSGRNTKIQTDATTKAQQQEQTTIPATTQQPQKPPQTSTQKTSPGGNDQDSNPAFFNN